MKAEIAKLLALFSEVEENGGSANLVLSTKGGKSIIKFTLESPPPDPATTAPTSPPAPGNQAAGRRRRRNRGAAARARRNQRAATSQATLAEVESPPHLPPSRPLHHLLSPSTTSGRRRVMSLGRPEMPTFSSLNLDGSSSPPPAPPHPPQPSAWICYDDCENDMHCSSCGKCIVLCKEHKGCDCDDVDGLEIDFHCAVCCCGRSLNSHDCKLQDLLSPDDYHTASHIYFS